MANSDFVEHIRFTAGHLPEGWTGTPDELVQAIVARISGYINEAYSLVVRGPVEPKQNMGPWIREVGGRSELRFWNDATGAYTDGVIPVGVSVEFGGTIAPEGWLLEDGSIQPIATYPALFGVIGHSYKTVDVLPVGYFQLPDHRGRSVTGTGRGLIKGNGIADDPNKDDVIFDERSLGQLWGADKIRIDAGQLPNHVHNVPYNKDEAGNGGGQKLVEHFIDVESTTETPEEQAGDELVVGKTGWQPSREEDSKPEWTTVTGPRIAMNKIIKW